MWHGLGVTHLLTSHRQTNYQRGYMTDKANTIGQALVPVDQTLIVITLTVAVPNYFCDDHSEQAHDAALDQIMTLITSDDEITVLGYDFKPLTLIVGA